MLKVVDTIEGSGFPLGFRVSDSSHRSSLILCQEGSDTITVECRAMGAHQKESVVTEGMGGAQWRMTSDEGPYLNGTDFAPFPLGFFNVGLQADLMNRLKHIANIRNIPLDDLQIDLDNFYSFSGSFFKGTGQGSADGVEIKIRIQSHSDTASIQALIQAACQASPAMAALHTPLENTFEIYVNGKCLNLKKNMNSQTAILDPFKKYQRLPSPLLKPNDQNDLITKMPYSSTEVMETMPSESVKTGLRVKGSSTFQANGYGVEAKTTLEKPVGSQFGFKTDEMNQHSSAPAGLSYLCAGIAFCYMTQLLRYSEYLKYKISDMRLVQMNPFQIKGSLEKNNLQATAQAVDTHLYLNGEESDEVMENLLKVAAKTCYLHAALSSSVMTKITVIHNGITI
jgi:uncharacterized OsmC-like protein